MSSFIYLCSLQLVIVSSHTFANIAHIGGEEGPSYAARESKDNYGLEFLAMDGCGITWY